VKERLITLALAVGALAFFYALFAPKSMPAGEKITIPVSTERGPNGYAAMVQWLAAESISVTSFRQRYSRLSDAAIGHGNLLITTMPHSLAARPSEIESLNRWIRDGNTVLVMAALADTPDWAMQPERRGDLLTQIKDMTGVEFVVAKQESSDSKKANDMAQAASRAQQMMDALARLAEPERRALVPIGSHPLLAGVDSVAALSEFPANDWRAKPRRLHTILEIAKREPANSPALWLAPVGDGQLIVSGFASPFTNKLLGQDDNARFLANIVRWSVGAGGKVIVDDAHQGAVSFYDPAAFFGDARLHRALWWLLLLWLVFVLGPARLRPTAVNWSPVDIAAFVRATGGFLARTVRPSEAGRRALFVFFNRIRRRLGLPEDGTPVWEWLAAQPNMHPAELMQLREYHARIVAGRRVDLSQLHNLLRQIEKRFTGNTL
jgi:hypothetical protein